MPKYSNEMEEKIIALFEQGKKNSVISRELSIDRGGLPRRRKAWEKRKSEPEKPESEKPEPETEKTIQTEQSDSHPLDPEIYTLVRYQGTNSREEAIKQAVETQKSLNPYILNHGLETPAELVKFFEDKSRIDFDKINDLKIDNNITQALIADYKETITQLKNEEDEQYDEGYDEGKKDYALIVYCTSCSQSITLMPGDETHRRIIEFCRDIEIIHSDCVPKYRRIFA